MTAFDLLHPALQHHIVNSLGWRELRPFQEAVIPSILAGEHHIILAPTAGGKTEAAYFPLLSRMLSENWSGLGILYICPIKALLNNLDARLERYATLVGRRSALWHGDVKPGAKKRILAEPPDTLLTTPESLEVMLVSPRVDHTRLFADLRAVVVDEVHAFAGDDRGWHLLAVLERITRLAGREIQRIGLSATVGNPQDLLGWLAGPCRAPKRCHLPPAGTGAPQADVQLDFVGSLVNAATVISRLHRGEKRLVFIDSRARAEELGSQLRQFGVTTFVTHSSLSHEQRQQAEEAFASRDDCVIVATSVLELGIDVGDLDRVIQIDAPHTVSSFLQRMGRTGRRAGTLRNCLFLATREESLLQAAALIELWREYYIEPVAPPPAPWHILAQQLMALALQQRGIGRTDWLRWVENMPGFAALPKPQIEELVAWMLDQTILASDNGILWFGRAGEGRFGRRNFLELVSVFTSPPLFTVLHGRRELGYVDDATFLQRRDGPRVLLLGGRAWQVNHIDWQRRIAYVEATDAPGKSRWSSAGVTLSFALCQAIKRVLASDTEPDYWSRRAKEKLSELRLEFPWLDRSALTLRAAEDGSTEWWTFGGGRANASLANELAQVLREHIDHDNLCLSFPAGISAQQIDAALQQLRHRDPADLYPAIDEKAVQGLKFRECLPEPLAVHMLRRRLQDAQAIQALLSAERRPLPAGPPDSTSTSSPRPKQGMRALSIRQPHAEAIMRGIKTVEYRSGPTNVRGRIHIYASLGRYPAEDEQEMLDEYGMEDVDPDELPRGVIVGTVELFDSEDGEWYLRDPQRAEELVAPLRRPNPVWFYPF